MKKLLLLCLLGGICLFSNTLRAQDRVADSPGTNFLHRFMSLRGGETRSDPYSEGFSLVDDSNSLGQEGEIPSASRGVNQGTILLYVQAKSDHEVGHLRATFLEEVLDENSAAPNFEEVREEFHPGTIWDGGFGAEWCRVALDATKGGLLSVYLDESKLIDQFLTFPGDSVKLFLNLERGEKVFAGPDYALYELQERAAQLLSRFLRDEGMGIHVREGENLFGSMENKEKFELAQKSFGAKAQVIPIIIPDMVNDWILQTREASYLKDLDELFSFYKGRIDPAVLQFLKQELRASFFSQQVGRLETILGYAKESESERDLVRKAFTEMLPEFQIKLQATADLPPPERQISLNFKILQTQAKLDHQPLLELIAAYPDEEFRDYLLSKLIFQQLKFGNTPHGVLNEQTAMVHNPDIKYGIQELVDAIQPQAAITDFAFQDETGKSYTLDDFKGKTVLVNTYFTGCSASASYYKNVLSRIAQEFEGEKELVLVSLSADRETDRWEKGNASGLYNSSQWLRLHTDGRGYSHPFFRNYLISSAPRPILIDPEGKLITMTQLYTDPNSLRSLIIQSLQSNAKNHAD